MQSRLNPYISFDGTAKEAMEFYKAVFGGQLVTNTYKDGGVPHDPSEADHLMHGMLEADNGIVLMGADIPKSSKFQPGTNIGISLSGDNEPELRGYWEKLSEGGKIREPLVTAPWGDTFGMLTDKFGIEWLVNISGKKA
jgi:PhnB protein